MENKDIVYHDARETYNSIADIYYELFNNELQNKPYDLDILYRFCDSFSIGNKICNVGCGPTEDITNILKERSMQITGIDISERCIEIAKMKNPEVTFLREDFLKSTLEENYFDGVISYHSLMYTPLRHIDIYFKNILRILKKGGKVLLATKEGNGETISNKILGITVNQPETYFTMSEIKNYFNKNGFKIIFLDIRDPYPDEIRVKRIYCVALKY